LREHFVGCCLPLALLPPALLPSALLLAICQLTLFTENPSKSTLAHDVVAAAVLHKHHPIIRVGAGLIQFVYGSHSRWATGVTSSKILFLPFFGASFQSFFVYSVVHCVWSFRLHMINFIVADISRFWSILCILELFAFSVFLCSSFWGA